MSRPRRKEIRVERHDHVGLVEVIDRSHWFPKCRHRTVVRRITNARLVLVPFRLGEFLKQAEELGGQRRRDNGFRQKAKPGPSVRLVLAHTVAEGVPGLVPCARRAGGVSRDSHPSLFLPS